MAALRGRENYSIPRKKSVYSVHEAGGKRTGTACAVKRNGKYYLVTWCRPGESVQPISVNRYCSRYPRHIDEHVYNNLPVDPTSKSENGLTFVLMKSKPYYFLEMAAKVPQNREKIKAYTFQGKNIIKLKFKRREGKYELQETKSKRRILDDLATGAPIIIKESRTNKRTVVGVLDADRCPVLYNEAATGSKGKKDPQPHVKETRHSFDVKKYKAQLAEHYQGIMSHVQRTPWNPRDTVPIDEIYTRLSWVQEGNELSDYTELFKTNEDGTKVKRILIEGDAGMGKSTHAKKMAVDWARGQNVFLQQFELVIVLMLRKICNKKTLKEALEASEVFSIDDPPIFDNLYDYILQHQEKVLFLFDGHDEYDLSDDVTRQTTHITQIMEGSRLKECYVVVTTRPWRANELRTHAYAHAKITGFNKEDVKRFCIKFLKNEKEASELCGYFYSHGLMDTVKVPLLLVFYCLLWKQTSKILPEDKTELYRKTVECILNHNKSKVGKLAGEKMEKHSKSLCLIGKVAFDALMKRSVLFAYEDLPEEVQRDDVLQLGFLSVTSTVAAYPEMKVSFLHKSLQEFLAAWYVTQCLLADFPNVLKKLRKIKHFENLSEFLKFVCGLSVQGSDQVFQRLQEVMISDNTLPHEPVPFKEMQKYFPNNLPLRLYQAAHPKAQLLTKLLKCTGGVLSFETRAYTASLKRLAKDLQNSSKTHKDMINALYLSHPSSEDIKELIKVTKALDAYVRVSSLGEYIPASNFMERLKCSSSCHKLSCSPCHPDRSCLYRSGDCIYLYFYGLTLSCDSHAEMFATHGDLEPKPVLQDSAISSPEKSCLNTSMATCLSFTSPLALSHLSEKTMEGITETLADNRSSRDTPQILLRHISLTPNVASALCASLNIISVPSTGHELEWSIGCHNEQVAYSQDSFEGKLQLLSRDVSATVLDASCKFLLMYPRSALTISGQQNIIEDEKLQVFMNVFSHTNVHELTLKSLCFPSLSSEDLVRHVGQRMEKLCLDDVRVDANDQPVITNCLQNPESAIGLPSLKSLTLCNMGQRETQSFIKIVGRMHSLEDLDLSGATFGKSCEHLCDVPNLQYVCLRNTGMGETEGKALAENIQHMRSLKQLYLSGNSLGKSTGLLAEYLCEAPDLTSFDLSNTGMGETEGEKLAENIQHIRSLEHLYLSGNSLGKSTGLLAEHLCDAPGLTIFDLSNTGMGETEGKKLAENIQHLCSLYRLTLSWNPLGKSTGLLAEHLCDVPELEVFDLRNTGMGETEGKKLAENIQHVRSLRWLMLSENPLGKSTGLLAEHFYDVPKLQVVDLSNTGMGETEGKTLAENIQHVRSLGWLKLAGNPLGKSTGLLAEHLFDVPELQGMDLSNCDMGEKELTLFTKNFPALTSHRPSLVGSQTSSVTRDAVEPPLFCLEEFLLDGNRLGESAALLTGCLPYCPRLRILSLRDCQIPKETETKLRELIDNLPNYPKISLLIRDGDIMPCSNYDERYADCLLF